MFNLVGENCCGCAACANICPKHCIQMTANEEGFLYPIIQEENCIHCGLCEKTCPVLHTDLQKKSELRQAWGVINKDRKILLESSSGGLFTALAQMILSLGGCVFGAAFTQGFQKVHHIMVENYEDLAKLRGSKYIQSEIGGIFKQVQEQLKTGRSVLFSGTPCQVAGLKQFLGRDYDKLYLVDVICHGTPSADLWRNYLSYVETKMHGKAKAVSFRHKRESWRKFGMQIPLEKGIAYYRSLQDDPYLKIFLRNVCLRESCYHCTIKENGVASDLTIGDFWGVEKILPDCNSEFGVSLALLHTEKGKTLFDQVQQSLISTRVDFDTALKGNPSYNQSVRRPLERDVFFSDMTSFSWRDLKQKYAHDPIKNVMKRKLSATVFGNIWRLIRSKLRGEVQHSLEYGLMIVVDQSNKGIGEKFQ